MKKYFKIWRQLSLNAINSYLANRLSSVAFLIGKFVRFGFFLLLIISIFKFTNNWAGYSKYEVILFFLTFNLLDVLGQAFLRGIYLFKDDINRGHFDYIISKPVNSLFFSLSRLTDILDIIFLFPIILLIIYTVSKLPFAVMVTNVLAYLFFILISLLIILALHIISACITIFTKEGENFIWLYRESISVGRFPPEIFSPAMQFLFTFIMPVIVIVAFPAKALLGILSWQGAVFALIYALVFFSLSLLLWKISLKHYASASS